MWFWVVIFFIKMHIGIIEHHYWLFFTLIFAHFLIISASFELTLIFKTCQILSLWNFTPQWYPKLELSSSLSKVSKNAKNAMSVLTWNRPKALWGCSTFGREINPWKSDHLQMFAFMSLQRFWEHTFTLKNDSFCK